jgi:hypothetical protein
MKQLTEDQYKEYVANPLAADSKVRKWCGLPENRYYTVSVWPEHISGVVTVDSTRFRVVAAQKISKSNQ